MKKTSLIIALIFHVFTINASLGDTIPEDLLPPKNCKSTSKNNPGTNINNKECTLLALGQIQDERALKYIISALLYKDEKIRKTAASLLCKFHITNPAYIPLLLQAAQDKNADVREKVVRVLWGYRNAEGFPTQLMLFKHSKDMNTKRKAAQFIFHHIWRVKTSDGEKIADLLFEELKNIDVQTRGYVALSLGAIRDPRAIPHLIETLQHPDKEVRKTAVDFLADRFKVSDIKYLTALADAAKKNEAYIRSRIVISIISSYNNAEAVSTLLELVNYPDSGMRHYVIGGLKRQDDPRIYEALLPLLKDKSPEVRYQSAIAIIELVGPKAVVPILEALKDKRIDKEFIIPELLKLNAVAPIVTTLTEELAAILSKDKGKTSRLTYSEIMQNIYGDKTYKTTLIEILVKLGAVEPLSRSLKSNDKELRYTLASKLDDLSSPNAIWMFKRIVKDPDKEVRTSAISSLYNIKNKRTNEILKERLKDKNSDVRAETAEILRKRIDFDKEMKKEKARYIKYVEKTTGIQKQIPYSEIEFTADIEAALLEYEKAIKKD